MRLLHSDQKKLILNALLNFLSGAFRATNPHKHNDDIVSAAGPPPYWPTGNMVDFLQRSPYKVLKN